MGRAIITYNAGGGLYRAKPLYNFVVLDKELADLQSQESEYASLLLKAFRSKELLEDELSSVTQAKNEVLKQWLDGLISKESAVPPELPPFVENDPSTGEPWVDPDRSQEQPLLDLINDYRDDNSLTPLTRNEQLNSAALNFLRYQAYTKKTGHFGAYQSTPESRAYEYGYSAERVEELIMQGSTSPAATFINWQRGNPEIMLDEDFVDCGVAYKYAPDHSATHLWCALFAVPGQTPAIIVSGEQNEPIKEDVAQKEQELEKIKIPRVEDTSPEKLGEIIQRYAIAASKVVFAKNKITQLMADRLARISRISELQNVKQELNSLEYDVWASFFNDEIPESTQVYTAEVPGYWLDEPIQKVSTIYEKTENERNVVYVERSWNIVLRVENMDSKLTPAISVNDIIYNYIAMEPGSIKWKPAYRYGFITAKSGDICNVNLLSAIARGAEYLEAIPLDLNQETELQNIPIEYPPCNGAVFEIGDEIIVRFQDFSWTNARVIGFRRVPKKCIGGGWQQIS